MFLYTETSLHIGSGTSLSAIDLPIQREKYTNFPNGAGSGVKGAVREWFENFGKLVNGKREKEDKEKIISVFGPEEDGSDHSGAVSFTDLRLLLFPVRSMKGVFAYVTSPFVLSRLKRELAQVGKNVDWNIELPGEDQAFTNLLNASIKTENSDLIINEKVVLEEFGFTANSSENLNKISGWLGENAIHNSADYEFWNKKVRKSLLLISDNNFKDFTEHSTEIQARIKLGEGKSSDSKKDGNLFYEENVPCDALFYSLVLTSNSHSPNPPESVKTDQEILNYIKQLNANRLQIGGDETIGKGIVNIKFLS
jgi:CRISPR-associated protein Cmr4